MWIICHTNETNDPVITTYSETDRGRAVGESPDAWILFFRKEDAEKMAEQWARNDELNVGSEEKYTVIEVDISPRRK